MTDAKSQHWYRLYASAAAELDRNRLIERVDATEAAIYGRLRALQYDSDHQEERQLIADAQDFLAFLRRRAASASRRQRATCRSCPQTL
jgi:chemotaxis regulatin CheY-phosphate phosphatase CheZ